MLKKSSRKFPYNIEYLAQKKAEGFNISNIKEKILLTADTIVFIDNKPIGKPNREKQYFLKFIKKKEHKVITGCCLKTNIRHQHLVYTNVFFKKLSK